MSTPTTVHVIDDDPAMRDSLSLLFAAEGYEVLSYESARNFLDTPSLAKSGCVITDVRMPDMSGIELLAAMKERRIPMPVIVVTAHADIPLAIEAMKRGAVDFFEKPFDKDNLIVSVRDAMLLGKDELARESRAYEEKLATLTQRENEVLAGLIEGRQNKVIAYALGISTRTVEVHRANLMSKMGAKSLSELVRMATLAQRLH